MRQGAGGGRCADAADLLIQVDPNRSKQLSPQHTSNCETQHTKRAGTRLLSRDSQLNMLYCDDRQMSIPAGVWRASIFLLPKYILHNRGVVGHVHFIVRMPLRIFSERAIMHVLGSFVRFKWYVCRGEQVRDYFLGHR